MLEPIMETATSSSTNSGIEILNFVRFPTSALSSSSLNNVHVSLELSVKNISSSGIILFSSKRTGRESVRYLNMINTVMTLVLLAWICYDDKYLESEGIRDVN